MYSWIASWMTGDDSQRDEVLYVENEDRKTEPDQWTWIEVIKDKEADDRTIFIQSTEEQRNKMIAGPSQEQKIRKRTRSEIKSRRAFKNSLYLDTPLFLEPRKAKPLKRLLKSYPVSLRALCKKHQSVSEVLSSTFPGGEFNQELYPRFNFLPSTIDHDWTTMIGKAVLLRTLMDIAIRSQRTQLEKGIEAWLNGLIHKLPSITWEEKKAIKWKKPLLAIEWRKQYPCIEWKTNDSVIDNCDLKVTGEKHYVPGWMSRMDVVEQSNVKVHKLMSRINIEEGESSERENITKTEKLKMITVNHYVPKWMSQIDVVEKSSSHVAELTSRMEIGEVRLTESNNVIDEDELKIIVVRHYVPKWMSQIDVVESFNKLPAWMRKIDITLFDDRIEENTPIQINEDMAPWMQQIDVFDTSSNCIEMPSWMKKIDVFEKVDQEEINTVPSWMQRIDVFEDGNQSTYDSNYLASWVKRLDAFKEETPDDVLQMCQWMEFMESPSYDDRPAPRSWFRGFTSNNHWCNPQPFYRVCQNMMSVAALIAACDVCTTTDISMPKAQTTCNTTSSDMKQKKHFSNMNKVDISKKKRSAVKKNKNWLRRSNTVNTLSMRRCKRSPTSFSGQGGVRGGVRLS